MVGVMGLAWYVMLLGGVSGIVMLAALRAQHKVPNSRKGQARVS